MTQEEFSQAVQVEIAKTIGPLMKRLADAEIKIQATSAVNESFKPLAKHAATCNPESMKADVLALAEQVKQIREAFATGRDMQPKITLSKEDYAKVLPARIAEASLQEVVEATGVKQ